MGALENIPTQGQALGTYPTDAKTFKTGGQDMMKLDVNSASVFASTLVLTQEKSALRTLRPVFDGDGVTMAPW